MWVLTFSMNYIVRKQKSGCPMHRLYVFIPDETCEAFSGTGYDSNDHCLFVANDASLVAKDPKGTRGHMTCQGSS